jgi:hypothetical protein
VAARPQPRAARGRHAHHALAPPRPPPAVGWQRAAQPLQLRQRLPASPCAAAVGGCRMVRTRACMRNRACTPHQTTAARCRRRTRTAPPAPRGPAPPRPPPAARPSPPTGPPPPRPGPAGGPACARRGWGAAARGRRGARR